MNTPTETTATAALPASEPDLTARIVDDPSVIDTLRHQISALDTAIANLIAERAQLSHRIQRARINAGGTRVELGRERAILKHYRDELGADGSALAEAVLRFCRGAR